MEKMKLQEIQNLVKSSVKNTLKESGNFPDKKDLKVSKSASKPSSKKNNFSNLKEALYATAKSFVLKTEKLSKATISSHENLYKKYIDTFNKISSELDATNKHEANSHSSVYRCFKKDENYNLNAIKLHELYFHNISDLASEIAIDSLPYIKLSRDFGNFENWQFDFMACAMSSREGWALTVYEPYKNIYMNICVDGHDVGMPLGCIPVLAIDMWSHSYYRDYETDKRSYLVGMMKEINWDVVEARMALVESSELTALYHIKPVYDDSSSQMLNIAQNAEKTPVAPTTPAAAAQQMYKSQSQPNQNVNNLQEKKK